MRKIMEPLKCPNCSKPMTCIREASLGAPIYADKNNAFFVKEEEYYLNSVVSWGARLECFECYKVSIPFDESETSHAKEVLELNKLWLEKEDDEEFESINDVPFLSEPPYALSREFTERAEFLLRAIIAGDKNALDLLDKTTVYYPDHVFLIDQKLTLSEEAKCLLKHVEDFNNMPSVQDERREGSLATLPEKAKRIQKTYNE
jgi:hypothetical protein